MSDWCGKARSLRGLAAESATAGPLYIFNSFYLKAGMPIKIVILNKKNGTNPRIRLWFEAYRNCRHR